MFRKIIIYLLVLTFSFLKGFSQLYRQIDSLGKICNRPSSDSQLIVNLDKLAEYYYIINLNYKGDSLLQRELEIADVSNNPNLKFIALFGNAILNLGSLTNSQSFATSLAFLHDGINYANSENNYDYASMGYIRLSYIYRNRGEYDSALINVRMAVEALTYVTNDSLKALTYLELGNAYAANNELVFACKNYNIAYDYALNVKSIVLQSEVHHNLSEVYKALNQDDEAKTELLKSLALNREYDFRPGLMKDYYDLARVTNSINYINKTIEEAKWLNDPNYILAGKRLMLAYIMVVEKNSVKAIKYLEDEPDLTDSYQNAGASIYNFQLANVYLYSGNGDSALKYFKLSESDILKKFDNEVLNAVYYGTASAFQMTGNWPSAIVYYNKAFKLYREQNDVASLAVVADSLSLLYSKVGKYKEAFNYSQQLIQFKKQIEAKSNSNEIALLQVERENRKHEEERKLSALQEYRKRNLQYMFISVSICIVFLFMLVLGAFSVSKLTIKLMGYFFFISVFEFLVLLIDNSFLEKAVHDEPFKLWIIKIVLIACLVPIQHFLEHNLITFLQSKRLLEARAKFSIKKIWRNVFSSKRPPDEQSIEEDTAVL